MSEAPIVSVCLCRRGLSKGCGEPAWSDDPSEPECPSCGRPWMARLPKSDVTRLIEWIADHTAAARREARAEMRERAAKACDERDRAEGDLAEKAKEFGVIRAHVNRAKSAHECAAAIRALGVDGE